MEIVVVASVWIRVMRADAQDALEARCSMLMRARCRCIAAAMRAEAEARAFVVYAAARRMIALFYAYLRHAMRCAPRCL